jgi:hypothetical protein
VYLEQTDATSAWGILKRARAQQTCGRGSPAVPPCTA